MVDVLIFLGQSNMQGQAERLSEQEIVVGAQEYKYCKDALLPLRNPVGEDIRIDGGEGWTYAGGAKGWDEWSEKHHTAWREENVLASACFGFTNLVPSFCRAYIAGTARQVVAVHCAKGDTKISEWQRGERIHTLLLLKIHAALEKVGKENIGKVYVVWLQGESDAVVGRKEEEYARLLIQLKEDIKAEIPLDKFAIIKVGAFTQDGRDEEIFAAQERVCANDPDFVMLTRISKELLLDEGCKNPYYEGHYSALGLERLGKAAGEALAKL